MSSKNRYGKFKKKDFVYILKRVRKFLCEKFGYRTKPYLLETELGKNELMMFAHHDKAYAILYDYKQFKKSFGKMNFEVQEAHAAGLMAHEMRHYYQHRQMLAKHPQESAETVALWRENELEPKDVAYGDSLSEYCMQPLELDAVLYEYVFAARIFEVLLLSALKDEAHYNAMEQLYISYCGETDEELFNDEIRKHLNERNNRE